MVWVEGMVCNSLMCRYEPPAGVGILPLLDMVCRNAYVDVGQGECTLDRDIPNTMIGSIRR